MPSKNDFTRRTFMAGTAAAAMTAKSFAQTSGANDRLNMAFIGCGGMAGGHIKSLLHMRKDENLRIAAVCDVYKQRANNFRDQTTADGADAPIVTQDYREVLAMPDIDYVLIATPEHSHCYLTLAALDAGKHVYVEKPMTHAIDEGQQVVAKVAATGLKLQVGVQGMADDSYESANRAIRAGKLGPVVQAQIDYVRNYSLAKGPWRRGDLTKYANKPADLDWETWVEPRKPRDWDPHHYFEWRNYADYSGGVATDLFVHRITRLIKACGLDYPTRVVGMGDITMWPDGRDLPDNFEMMAEYPAKEGVTPGMTMHLLGSMANKYANKHCIRGHEATLIFNSKGWEIVSQDSGTTIETHTKTGGEDVTPHHKNHHAAIRNGAELNCPAELGLHAVVAVRMANLSWFKRKMIAWNREDERAVLE